MIIRPSRVKELPEYWLAGAIPLITQALMPSITIYGLTISAGLVMTAEINRLRHKYLMNDDELLKESGLLSKNRSSVKIKDIIKINIKQSLVERLLNIGHLEVETKSTPVKMNNIRQPRIIAERIKELQKDNEL